MRICLYLSIAPAKGLPAILFRLQSKLDSNMVKIRPFTVSPLNPPSSRQHELSLDSKLDLHPWPKDLRMTKYCRNCCLRILWKANSHFAMKMTLIPFKKNPNIFTEFQTWYKITGWHHVSDSLIYTGECSRGLSCRSLFDPDWIRGQTGSIKKMVMLQFSVLPLLTDARSHNCFRKKSFRGDDIASSRFVSKLVISWIILNFQVHSCDEGLEQQGMLK